jgi:TPP-dependent pyruvate/acetoin dehydrogenase alpha subunit
VNKAELDRIDSETAAELEDAIKFARASEFPDVSEVTDDVFAK